jgi:hypothetical protein
MHAAQFNPETIAAAGTVLLATLYDNLVLDRTMQRRVLGAREYDRRLDALWAELAERANVDEVRRLVALVGVN